MEHISDDETALLEEVLAIEEEQKGKKNKESRHSAVPPPPKKERPPPPEPPVAGPSRPPQGTPAIKVKKPTNGHATPSVKGKEKEKESPRAPSTSKSRSSATPGEGTPINEKKCKEILKKLSGMEEALLFLQPVDPVLLGCPTYVFVHCFTCSF